jgi:hypothetical protein
MPLRVIESKERLFEALLERAPLRSLCFLVIEKHNQKTNQSISQSPF